MIWAMDGSTAYDADILEWSERQASALRDFARTHRELSNELDWEHVAEEIEDVGRSELMAVQSLIRQILVHVINALSAPDAASMLHWRKEVVGFHHDLLDRVTPSMPSPIALDVLWQRSIKEADAALAIHGQSVTPALPAECPLKLDDIVSRAFDFVAVVATCKGKSSKIRAAMMVPRGCHHESATACSSIASPPTCWLSRVTQPRRMIREQL